MFAGCREGRTSEPSRQVTYLVLFSSNGRPGAWLMLIAILWAIVAAVALGTPA